MTQANYADACTPEIEKMIDNLLASMPYAIHDGRIDDIAMRNQLRDAFATLLEKELEGIVGEVEGMEKDAEKYPVIYLGNPTKSEGHNAGYKSALTDTAAILRKRIDEI